MRFLNRSSLLFVLLAAAVTIGACGDDDTSGTTVAAESTGSGITEGNLPEGFEAAPTVKLAGKTWSFDKIPGHYWKVLDKRGFAIGLHFQTEKPFPWAKDVPKGELLYITYAIPGNCGDGNYAKAVKSKKATIDGRAPGGFDHWHAVVGGKSRVGHWLMHVPVRDFTFGGPPKNPDEGKSVSAATPGFIPVCDIR